MPGAPGVASAGIAALAFVAIGPATRRMITDTTVAEGLAGAGWCGQYDTQDNRYDDDDMVSGFV